jgi:rhamnosyltransferase
MLKIVGVVTAYFPNLEELEKNINSYLPWIDHLIIWENTPKTESKIDLITNKLNNKKIEVRTTGKNEYLAQPFNICFDWARNEGYTHVLTMDQDSRFLESQFNEFRQLIENNYNDDIAIYAPAINKSIKSDSSFIEVDNSITSGSIYSLSSFQKIGYFREDFLIYMVDTEFGIRVRNKGFRILCFPDIILKHESGYAQKSKQGFILNMYSAQSTYYIIRNIILTWKLYPDKSTLKEKIFLIKYKVIYRTVKIIFESNKTKKLKGIYLGLIHGLIGKSGRYDL